MPAHQFEADEAMTEGVKIHWLRTIKEIDGADLTVEVMEIDDKGKARPTGKFETLQADAVVLALGQDSDSGFLHKIKEIEFGPDGTVIVAPNMMTGSHGIFAGGDLIPCERTVTVAVGGGKKAARNIDAWLRSTTYAPPPKHTIVTFGMLNLPIFSDVLVHSQRELSVEERTAVFRGSRCRSGRAGGNRGSEALPLVRQLLRMRQLLCGVSGRCDCQVGHRQGVRC